MTVCFGFVPAHAVELMLKVTPGLGVQESDVHPGPQIAPTETMIGEIASIAEMASITILTILNLNNHLGSTLPHRVVLALTTFAGNLSPKEVEWSM